MDFPFVQSGVTQLLSSHTPETRKRKLDTNLSPRASTRPSNFTSYCSSVFSYFPNSFCRRDQKSLKCSEETGLTEKTEAPHKKRENLTEYKANTHYFTSGQTFQRTQGGKKHIIRLFSFCLCSSAESPPPGGFSTLALWCNPRCECSCTGRWTGSSPAAQSEPLRRRCPGPPRCW